MRDDEFKKALDTWAESEVESAPELHPTAEMVRLVQAKQKASRTLPGVSPWALVGAATAGLVLIATLLALILNSGIVPGYSPTPEGMLVAQRVGPVEVQTAIVKGGGKGRGEKGSTQVAAVFRQLELQYKEQDSPTVQAVDLLNPPEETTTLTADDNYRLILEPAEEIHAYVYQLTSSGDLVELFPNTAYGQVSNPLAARQPTVLPAEPNWFYLDDTPGEERLFVVASPKPLEGLDGLYDQYVQAADGASKREPLSALLDLFKDIAANDPKGAVETEFVFQHR
jgi:hypothetical protein